MARQEALTRDRAATRRPIGSEEVLALEALGREIRRLQNRCGLTQAQLGERSGFGAYVSKLERGARRSRLSTLERLGAALVEAEPGIGPVEALVARLVALAGETLAAPTAYPDLDGSRKLRKERRARRRERQRVREAESKQRRGRRYPRSWLAEG